MQYGEFIAQNRSIQHDIFCPIIGLNFPVQYFPRRGSSSEKPNERKRGTKVPRTGRRGWLSHLRQKCTMRERDDSHE